MKDTEGVGRILWTRLNKVTKERQGKRILEEGN
jgi:hypothetical protein